MIINLGLSIWGGQISQIEEGVAKEFARHLHRALADARESIRNRTKSAIQTSLLSSREWAEITDGQLRQDLFIRNIASVMGDVLTALQRSIQIDYVKPTIAGKNVTGGLSVSLLEDNYSAVLGVPGVSYVTANNVPINWMEWLLFAGNSAVLPRMRLIENRGQILAVRSNRDYVIPSSIAGTANNNFLTRSLARTERDIAMIIEQEVKSRT